MNYKLLIIAVAIVLAPVMSSAEGVMSLSEVRHKAEQYYGAMKTIAENPVGESCVIARLKLQNEIVGVDRNGHPLGQELRIPNELDLIFQHKQDGLSELALPTYINTLIDVASQDPIVFNYNIKDCQYLQNAEAHKGEDKPHFARVVIDKEFRIRNATERFTDTMLINVRFNSIWHVSNVANINVSDMSVSTMMAQAVMYYSDKRYAQACAMYKKIMKKDPTYGPSSYALGVMALKGQGCMSQYPRKVRDYLVYYYWIRSGHGIASLLFNLNTKPTKLPVWEGDIEPFHSGLMIAYNVSKKKYGFMSEKGDMVIPQKYIYAYPFFSDGTAMVCTDNHEWFRINTKGKVIDVVADVRWYERGEFLFLFDSNDRILALYDWKFDRWQISLE